MKSAKSVNFRRSSHTEGDRCQQVLLQIFVDGTLSFNFLGTASDYTFPLFDNSILKMVKTCHIVKHSLRWSNI